MDMNEILNKEEMEIENISATGTDMVIVPGIGYATERTIDTTNVVDKFLIGRNPDICGGSPILLGTRVSVHHLIEMILNLKWNKERVLAEYRNLSPEQFDAVWAYYRDHTSEIEDLINEEQSAQ